MQDVQSVTLILKILKTALSLGIPEKFVYDLRRNNTKSVQKLFRRSTSTLDRLQ